MVPKRTLLFLMFLAVPVCAILTQCLSSKEQHDPRDRVFAGSKTCESCHKAQYQSYLHTAHYLTSRPADINTIHGSFAAGKNVFSFGNGMTVAMEQRKSGLYQAGYINGKPAGAERFDITIG
jgi:hypothetical protein